MPTTIGRPYTPLHARDLNASHIGEPWARNEADAAIAANPNRGRIAQRLTS